MQSTPLPLLPQSQEIEIETSDGVDGMDIPDQCTSRRHVGVHRCQSINPAYRFLRLNPQHRRGEHRRMPE